MQEWNAINTEFHYFDADKVKRQSNLTQKSFTVWVGASKVVKAPPPHKSLVGQHIDQVIARLTKKGYQHHKV